MQRGPFHICRAAIGTLSNATGKGIERLLTAYQEDLLSLDELRRRMPELRAREQGLRAELQAIRDQAADRLSFLRLAETLTAFLQRLRQSAETLDICGRQRIVRLLVKEVLVDHHHSSLDPDATNYALGRQRTAALQWQCAVLRPNLPFAFRALCPPLAGCPATRPRSEIIIMCPRYSGSTSTQPRQKRGR